MTPPTSPRSSSSPAPARPGYLPPPKGYLQRLRQICDKHGILLIFDEVITGFAVSARLSRRQVRRHPDLMTVAKGISNATVPMGGVFVRKPVFDGLMERTGKRHRPVPRLHLLGPSAGLRGGVGVLDIYRDENLFEALGRAVALLGRGRALLEGPAECRRHPQPRLAAGIDLAPKGAVGTRGYEAFQQAFELG